MFADEVFSPSLESSKMHWTHRYNAGVSNKRRREQKRGRTSRGRIPLPNNDVLEDSRLFVHDLHDDEHALSYGSHLSSWRNDRREGDEGGIFSFFRCAFLRSGVRRGGGSVAEENAEVTGDGTGLGRGRSRGRGAGTEVGD